MGGRVGISSGRGSGARSRGRSARRARRRDGRTRRVGHAARRRHCETQQGGAAPAETAPFAAHAAALGALRGTQRPVFLSCVLRYGPLDANVVIGWLVASSSHLHFIKASDAPFAEKGTPAARALSAAKSPAPSSASGSAWRAGLGAVLARSASCLQPVAPRQRDVGALPAGEKPVIALQLLDRARSIDSEDNTDDDDDDDDAEAATTERFQLELCHFLDSEAAPSAS